MKCVETTLPGVTLITPKVFFDDRGFFLETYHKKRYEDAGIFEDFVQTNLSYSQKNTLRGLHYQHPHAQGKLVSVVRGKVQDVAVDVRLGSPTFGQSVSVILSDENHAQLYVPPGFAHGFCVLSEDALFSYQCTDYYAPNAEWGIKWNDPDLGIDWSVSNPIISDKDDEYPCLKNISQDSLPVYTV